MWKSTHWTFSPGLFTCDIQGTWRDEKMKRMIKAINYYFFPDDEGEGVHWSDYAWFYGTLGLMVIILISLLFADLAN